ncbi:MAG TPA: helicase HerA-like domain-containing protein, partial [Sphingomicrobium sp.]|nr:helicase HerA-like domain-containing protein [Sphingomicrobium sp.]
RPNPEVDVARAITELKVGEALVSLLLPDGAPSPVERTLIKPPGSRVGPLTQQERAILVQTDAIGAKYDQLLDRDSAEEILKAKGDEAAAAAAAAKAQSDADRAAAEAARQQAIADKEAARQRVAAEREAVRQQREADREADRLRREQEREAARQAREAAKPTMADKMIQSAGRSIASSVGRQLGNSLLRGIFGGLLRGR